MVDEDALPPAEKEESACGSAQPLQGNKVNTQARITGDLNSPGDAGLPFWVAAAPASAC